MTFCFICSTAFRNHFSYLLKQIGVWVSCVKRNLTVLANFFKHFVFEGKKFILLGHLAKIKHIVHQWMSDTNCFHYSFAGFLLQLLIISACIFLGNTIVKLSSSSSLQNSFKVDCFLLADIREKNPWICSLESHSVLLNIRAPYAPELSAYHLLLAKIIPFFLSQVQSQTFL